MMGMVLPNCRAHAEHWQLLILVGGAVNSWQPISLFLSVIYVSSARLNNWKGLRFDLQFRQRNVQFIQRIIHFIRLLIKFEPTKFS